MAVGGGSCSVCKRCIALTKAGVIRLHGPVRARCSGFGPSPSRCVLPRPQAVMAADSNQLTVPPASITGRRRRRRRRSGRGRRGGGSDGGGGGGEVEEEEVVVVMGLLPITFLHLGYPL